MGTITFGDLHGFYLVGHQHETGAENDDVEFLIGMIFFKVIEIHMFDLDVFMLLEEFLAGGDVAAVDINSEDLGVFEAVDYAFEGMACCSSNIEHFLDWFFSINRSLPNGLVSNPKYMHINTW